MSQKNSNSNLFYKHLEKKKLNSQNPSTTSVEIQPEKSSNVSTTSQVNNEGSSKNIVNSDITASSSASHKSFNYKESSFFEKAKSTASFNSILINPCQKGNPLISNLRNCTWSYAEVEEKNQNKRPDYQIGKGIGAIFLSLKYHKLHPEYIYQRITALGAISRENDSSSFGFRSLFLLICVDVPDHHESLKELQCLSISSLITVFLCWNFDEAAKYIEAFKKMETKSPESLKEREAPVGEEGAQKAKFNSVLGKIRTINKTDVSTLTNNFSNFKTLAQASPEQLALCPGLGGKKVIQLRKAFTQPFSLK